MRRMILYVKVAARNQMMVELLLVFDGLHAKKNSAESKSSDQENTDQFLLAHLGGPDSHSHGQAAHDKDNGIAGAQFNVQRVAANAKSGAESTAIDGVGEEHAAEEQDFGDQENPHAERGGFLLLLERLKMSVQFSGAVHSVLLFLSQSMAWLRPLTGRTEVRPCTKNKKPNHLHEPGQATALPPPNQGPGGSESRTAPR